MEGVVPMADILICQNLHQVMELGNILQQTGNPDQDNMYKEVTTRQVVVADQLQVEQGEEEADSAGGIFCCLFCKI